MKSATPEQKLLFQILKGEEISLPAGFDPDVFIKLLQRHKLLPLGEALLQELSGEGKAKLKAHLVEWAARSMLLFQELQVIRKLAKDHQLDIICVKGPLLAWQLYGTFHSRYYTDLDIIVSQVDLLIFADLLQANGYTLQIPEKGTGLIDWEEHGKYNNDIVLYHSGRNIHLEVHFGIHIEQLLGKNEAALILKGTKIFSINGSDFLTLGNEENFLYLCLHGAKHMFFRLCWLGDLAAFLDEIKMKHQEVLLLAKQSGLEKILALSLRMVSKYFRHVRIPSEYDDLLEKYRLTTMLRWNEIIVNGPGELVYEGYLKHRRKKNQIRGIDRVRFRHFLVQISYLLALRKGVNRKIRFLFYQIKKRG